MNTYIRGNIIRVAGSYTGSTGVPTDPTAIHCVVLAPGTLPVEYVYGSDAAVVRVSAGSYYLDIDADLAGVWRYRWYSTGTSQAANEGAFHIAPSQFPREV